MTTRPLVTCPKCLTQRSVGRGQEWRIRTGRRSGLCLACRSPWRHGTVYAYSEKGCRCEPCREAKRLKEQRRGERYAAEGQVRPWKRYGRTPAERKASRERKRRRYANDPAYREKVKERARNVPKVAQRARQAVKTAIKQGVLVRPDCCSQCGGAAYIEAAHIDYSKPLEVRWLCRPCHRLWDRAEPKTKAA